jgi:lysyl-tRNA synthetase class 2
MAARHFSDQELIRREKLSKLQKENKDPFVIQKFERNFNTESFKKQFEQFSKEQLHEDNTEILIAGRVMAIRQSFGVIQDFYGRLQFYINKKE